MIKDSFLISALLVGFIILNSRNTGGSPPVADNSQAKTVQADTAVFYLYRPELEKAYGYSHAVKIGNDIKVSGAVSIDSAGNLVAPGNMEQQMKNCYADLEKILAHFGCTFDDVVVENIFTTNMQEFIKIAGTRSSIYKKHFPAGNWLGVKELALEGQLIEIDMEARVSK